MSIRNFLRPSTRNSSSGLSPSGSTLPYYAAASKRLQKARASSSLSSQASSRDDTSSSINTAPESSHEFPNDETLNLGILFEIDWDNIWKDGTKLSKHRIG